MAEKKINGVEYRVQPLAAVDAIELYADILRFLGPAASRLPAIIMAISSSDEGQEMMADVAALAAISDILSRVPSAQVSDLVKRIVSIARIKRPSGQYDPADLDGDFTGNLPNLMPVIKFILEEQFRDFFIGGGKSGIISLLTEVLRNKKPSA
ncbi:hypothetical protein EHI47_11725 [Rhizobium leguminosarum]|uniref:Uncharacterized protein n=1 Tax=Rhizobium leguminosarum TaxID=384 RepID=A0A444I3J1_RHILE|nr:hypothetical protein [Rhizobium leguminosarum]RWX32044.1 hypothetical protein EHI47_11725 [Rhizobium leguminosarum]